MVLGMVAPFLGKGGSVKGLSCGREGRPGIFRRAGLFQETVDWTKGGFRRGTKGLKRFEVQDGRDEDQGSRIEEQPLNHLFINIGKISLSGFEGRGNRHKFALLSSNPRIPEPG
jgi:hypothetical protein